MDTVEEKDRERGVEMMGGVGGDDGVEGRTLFYLLGVCFCVSLGRLKIYAVQANKSMWK